MANVVTIEAEARARAGKGAARATRRAGKVPAVVYGAHIAPSLIALEPRTVMREISRAGWQSRVYEINGVGAPTRARGGADEEGRAGDGASCAHPHSSAADARRTATQRPSAVGREAAAKPPARFADTASQPCALRRRSSSTAAPPTSTVPATAAPVATVLPPP